MVVSNWGNYIMKISCDKYEELISLLDTIASVKVNDIVVFEIDAYANIYHINESKNMLDTDAINILSKVNAVLEEYGDTCFKNNILTETGKHVAQLWLSLVCDYISSSVN